MDRLLLTGAVSLLIFECLFFLGDLGYIDLPLWNVSMEDQKREPRGKVISTFQNVRRKNQSSLIWEPSETKDILYEKDSILTLKNSSARLQLEGDVTLDLRENTLVVLESDTDKQEQGLRLKFSKGNLRGKSGGQSFRLGHGEWSFHAKPGSEMAVWSSGDNEVEVEVTQEQSRAGAALVIAGMAAVNKRRNCAENQLVILAVKVAVDNDVALA